ncbi:DUF2059 domain-containing protein [Aequorivita sinensis]|uniref:DUF2059 domain-containing protein n=1 Tax=Aequorivita sinensis TaxID=1382458 RepID=UPI002301656F|nr:DUF2059 domain-containing protein [Aequorivita sinensis]
MNRIITIAFLILSTNFLYSQTDSIDSKIREMIDVLGSTERMKTVANNVIEIQEQQNPFLKDSEYWQEFKSNIYDYSFDHLIDSLIPIYKKHLTIEEIESITEFYSSPSGQAMVQKFPLISTESMQVGAAWGEQMSNKIEQEIQASKEKKFNSPATGCSNFKIGSFKYFDNQDNPIEIKREKDYQVETVNGKTYKSKISWTGDCEYRIWKFQDDNDYSNIVPLLVTIYESDKEGYKYIYKQEGGTKFYLGEIKLVE